VLDGSAATAGDHETVRTRSPLYRELLGHWSGDPDTGTRSRAGVGRPEPRTDDMQSTYARRSVATT